MRNDENFGTVNLSLKITCKAENIAGAYETLAQNFEDIILVGLKSLPQNDELKGEAIGLFSRRNEKGKRESREKGRRIQAHLLSRERAASNVMTLQHKCQGRLSQCFVAVHILMCSQYVYCY